MNNNEENNIEEPNSEEINNNEENNIEPNNEEFNNTLYIELFEDLFAYRFYLLDIYENNEIEIIKKLKIKVFNLGYNVNRINLIVFNFYKYYNINVSLNEIENVVILVLLPMISIENNNDNTDNNIYNIDNINDLLINIFGNTDINENEPASRFLSMIRNRINRPLEDVKITLDESELNKLITYKLPQTLEEKCVICIGELEEGNEVMELPCKHLFHCECIKSLLLNYDYKCPVCRHDIGKHKINL